MHFTLSFLPRDDQAKAAIKFGYTLPTSNLISTCHWSLSHFSEFLTVYSRATWAAHWETTSLLTALIIGKLQMQHRDLIHHQYLTHCIYWACTNRRWCWKEIISAIDTLSRFLRQEAAASRLILEWNSHRIKKCKVIFGFRSCQSQAR